MNNNRDHLLPNAPLYLIQYMWPPPHERIDKVSNILGPWVNVEIDRGRLLTFLLACYSSHEDLHITKEYLESNFATMVNQRQENNFIKRTHLGTLRNVFAIRAELDFDSNIASRVLSAAAQPNLVDFYIVRMLRGKGELITEATREAIVKTYIIPRGSSFTIGEMSVHQTLDSRDKAEEYAKELLEAQEVDHKGKIPKDFANTSGVQWMMNPTGDTLKWVVSITKMVVNNQKRGP